MASTISQGLLLTIALAPLAGALIAGLAGKQVGAPVNLEVDIIGKYVEKLLGGYTRT